MAIQYPSGTTPTLPVLQSDTFEIQRQKINNLVNGIYGGPQFIAPWTVVSTVYSFGYTQYTLSSYIPAGVHSAILQIRFGGNSSTTNTLTAKATSGGSEYEIASAYAGGSGDNPGSTVQATIPIDSTTTSFYMKLLNNMTGNQTCIVKLIGYYY